MVESLSGSFTSDKPKGFRSGFVALIGRPNVGKSTLVNQLIGDKIAITSPVAQTTRNRLRAILTTDEAQLILVDTPGIHKPHHLLGERLVRSARSAIGEVDQVLLLLEGCEAPGRGDAFIVQLLRQQSLRVQVLLTDCSGPGRVRRPVAQHHALVVASFSTHVRHAEVYNVDLAFELRLILVRIFRNSYHGTTFEFIRTTSRSTA